MIFTRFAAPTFAVLAMAAGASAQSIGADVSYTDCQGISNYGAVGAVRAYALGSYTCNLGNVSLRWENNGTPGLAMNAYRLRNGLLQQVGMSFVKRSCCAASGTGCGVTCNTGAPGSGLKPGCRDVYSSGYNGGQGRMSPRSTINAFTGAFSTFNGNSGDAIFKRLQIATADLDPAAPGSQYFVEGVYVGTDDAQNGNAMNNASYKRVTVDAAYNLNISGTQVLGSPAILAWRAHGLGVNTPDTSVENQTIDVPGEGRFYIASKVTDLGGGRFRYDYAIFNLNSDRAGGSFEVPVPAGVNVTNIGFSDVNYHSGEVYDNTNWSATRTAEGVRWASPQTFAQNANSNAIRWGTMYNFWFEGDRAPRQALTSLGLFKPGSPAAISPTLRVPGCPADFNNDGGVDGDDVIAFFAEWDRNSPDGDYNRDGGTDGDDVIAFFSNWDNNC